MPNLDEILRLATDTKSLLTGEKTVEGAPAMFRTLFPGKRPVIVADTNTWRVAGNRVHTLMSEAGLNPEEPMVFTDPDIHAEWSFIERLDDRLSATGGIAVAVGSGTVNDLCKLSSHHAGKRYMTVGTAASMDGYTAYGASVIRNGAKQTFSCPAPLGFIADIDIIATAPTSMTASGYADLFAKVPAGADWILSDALGVEPIDPVAFSTVQEGLKSALGDPEGLRKGDHKALHRLIEGLLLGGFAMQIHRSSRPASGAEHQFSHLWNMEHHRMADGRVPSHGFQVSVGTLTSTALYEQALNEDFSRLDIEACVAAWPSLEDTREEALRLFKDTDFPTIGATETEAKYIGPDRLRRQLTVLRDNWPEIRRRLRAQLVPSGELRRRLGAVGAPVDPEQIGISHERLRVSADRAQRIRRRFTILDLGVRTCRLASWISHL